MLGFGKKKKADSTREAPATDAGDDAQKNGDDAADLKKEDKGNKGPTKKRFTLKKLILFVLLPILISAGAAGYYSFFFKKGDAPIAYKKISLDHVGLPGEMLKFCFDRFPDLYRSLVAYNRQVILFDAEINRINALGKKYPDQIKITDREKKIWLKSKTSLVKIFSKLEKPIREIYVLYQANPEQGAALIKEKSQELSDTAQTALNAVQELSLKLNTVEQDVPKNFLLKWIYNLKKKFL